jgi:transcriptional regulator with XRE-family HTH domain
VSLYDLIASRYGDPAAFVRRLKSTMLLHGITQGELARVSGYDRSTITHLLSQRRRPSMEAMVTLDEAIEAILKPEDATPRAA